MVDNFNPKCKILHLEVEIQPGWAVWHRCAYSRSGSNSCTENQLEDGEMIEGFSTRDRESRILNSKATKHLSDGTQMSLGLKIFHKCIATYRHTTGPTKPAVVIDVALSINTEMRGMKP
jgi:hypothetical protein